MRWLVVLLILTTACALVAPRAEIGEVAGVAVTAKSGPGGDICVEFGQDALHGGGCHARDETAVMVTGAFAGRPATPILAGHVPGDIAAVRLQMGELVVEPELTDNRIGRFFVAVLPELGEWQVSALDAQGLVWAASEIGVREDGSGTLVMSP